MDTTFHFFYNNVFMFHNWFIQTFAEINPGAELLPLIGIVFIIALGVVLLNQHFQKNLYRQQLEKEEIRNQQQIELLRSSIMVQEKERKRIAQDIHDELGALLSISRMHLVHLEEKAPEPENLGKSLVNIRTLIEKSLSSMRKISHELMPPQLETFGLVKTLEAVADHANNTDSIHIQIEVITPLPPLNWPVELGLYRICMELINNTIKHAQADTITIQLQYNSSQIECTYTDNGIGLSIDQKEAGLGYKGMQGRANSLGGSILFDKPEKGFMAKIIIPINE